MEEVTVADWVDLNTLKNLLQFVYTGEFLFFLLFFFFFSFLP